MAEESWKNISGLPIGYEISCYGNVRLKYEDHIEVIEPHDTKDGYKVIYVCGKSIRLHYAVAEAFVDNPENKPLVNFIDHDKSNICADNLIWVTHKEVVLHKWASKSNIGKAVRCKDTNQVFSTLSTASAFIGIPISCIKHSADDAIACCGLYFEYVDVDDLKDVIYVAESDLPTLAEKANSIEEFRELLNN